MNQLEHSQSARRFFRSRLFLLILLGIAILISFNYARVYYQDYEIRKEIRQLEEEVRSLEQKKLESLNILQYVTSNSFVEEKARTELNMKKPGEQVAIIHTPSIEMGEAVVSPEEDTLTDVANPLKWWYYFVKKKGSEE